MSRSLRRIAVTGGAGFVGSHLALALAREHAGARVVALDNLKRRGSELALARLRDGGVEFAHTDVRYSEDLLAVGDVDLVLDCAAEPAVLAGFGPGADYLLRTNLVGTINTLELARRSGAGVVFLSTSRVYPYRALAELPLDEKQSRFELRDPVELEGASAEGISEEFALDGPRTLYGASKLASELLVQEYAAQYGLPSVIDRCGVIAGPWQMGKQDQGFLVHWVARHVYGGELDYIGYGGSGRQVRDVLHVDDLCELVLLQVARLDECGGATFNVGGGSANSVSLCELTEHCRAVTGRSVPVGAKVETRPGDVPWYVTDATRVREHFGWHPRRNLRDLVRGVAAWIESNQESLRPVLGASR